MGYIHKELRPYSGAPVSSSAELQVVSAGTTYDFLDMAGIGVLHWVLMRARAGASSELIFPMIKVDGTYLQPKMSYSLYNGYGFDGDTRPIQILQYGVDGNCTIIWYFETGLGFNKSLMIQGQNPTGGDLVMDCFYSYTAYLS